MTRSRQSSASPCQGLKFRCYGVGVLLALAGIAGMSDRSIADTYQKGFQGAFYCGSLIAAIGILCAKRAIVARVRFRILQSPAFLQMAKQAEAIVGRPVGFDPDQVTRRFCNWAVGFCLASAAIQGTIGFLPSGWAVAACLVSAGTALQAVLFCLGGLLRAPRSESQEAKGHP